MTQPLDGRIALVAGATRGAGRGIACMLGEAGATVYCSGRGTRAHPTDRGYFAGRPETIDETAEMVSARGGCGIPVRTDHLEPAEVEALVARVRRDHGRLDILVNDMSEGGLHDWTPFWKADPLRGFEMFRNGVHTHILTAQLAAPLMIESASQPPRRTGLVVEIGDGAALDFRGTLFYDLIKLTVSRFAYVMGEELHSHNVAALALTPGFMRTESILDQFGVTEANWRDGGTKNPAFLSSETPFYVGRAVAALGADPNVLGKSGGLYSSWDLAREYGFTDVDGARPDLGTAFDFERHFASSSKTGFRWTVTRPGGSDAD